MWDYDEWAKYLSDFLRESSQSGNEKKKKKKTDMMNLRAQVLCLKKFLNIDTAV